MIHHNARIKPGTRIDDTTFWHLWGNHIHGVQHELQTYIDMLYFAQFKYWQCNECLAVAKKIQFEEGIEFFAKWRSNQEYYIDILQRVINQINRQHLN